MISMLSTDVDLNDPPTVQPRRAEEVREIDAEIEEVESRLDALKEKRDKAGREATRKWKRVRDLRGTTDSTRLREVEREASQAEKKVTELEGHVEDVAEELSSLREKRRDAIQSVSAATEEEVRRYFERGVERLHELLTQMKDEGLPLYENLRALSEGLRSHNRKARNRDDDKTPVEVEEPPLPMTMGKWRRFIQQWEEELDDAPYG